MLPCRPVTHLVRNARALRPLRLPLLQHVRPLCLGLTPAPSRRSHRLARSLLLAPAPASTQVVFAAGAQDAALNAISGARSRLSLPIPRIWSPTHLQTAPFLPARPLCLSLWPAISLQVSHPTAVLLLALGSHRSALRGSTIQYSINSKPRFHHHLLNLAGSRSPRLSVTL